MNIQYLGLLPIIIVLAVIVDDFRVNTKHSLIWFLVTKVMPVFCVITVISFVIFWSIGLFK